MIDAGLIQSVHAGPHKMVLAITGGSSAIGNLLQVPGASSSILEAVVPYSHAALGSWLGREPESFCSRETALSMATVAWHRAKFLAGQSDQIVADCLGVACTAALVSNSPKRGEHRCWVAVESSRGSTIRSLVLNKGVRDRAGEESIVGDLIIASIAEVSLGISTDVPGLLAAEDVAVEDVALPDPIQNVRDGAADVVWSLPTGELASFLPTESVPRGLLSGAFNPLHAGHRGLRDTAEAILGGPVCFEMPIRNADKPPLDAASIERRRRQFQTAPVALSAAPRFVDKATIFHDTTFVVGYDTAERIIQPRFYDNSESAMQQSFQTVRARGCRFLVAGRKSDGEFATLDDLALPDELRDLFEMVPEEKFRRDISSTELRQSVDG